MAKQTDGAKSNQNGKALEELVENIVKINGYVKLTHDEKEQLKRGELKMKGSFYTTQVLLDKNLYGGKFYSDLFIRDNKNYPNGCHIECKWQGSAGSIDEKYVFTVQSLKKTGRPSILILAGNGAKKIAVDWIRRQESSNFKFFRSTDEFLMFANTELRKTRKRRVT